jgi:hypothetical protein
MSMTATNSVNFQYIKCSRETLESKEASFDESQFSAELQKVFETQLQVNSAVVEIKEDTNTPGEEFTCLILIKGPQFDITQEKKGNDPAAVTRECIHSTLHQLRELKEKLKHS